MFIEETDLRQEFKFYASSQPEAASLLKQLQALPDFSSLKKAFWTRKIYNIYFDSIHQDAQISSLEGYTNRSKIRARWYHTHQTEINVSLEQKIKLKNLGKKKIQSLFKCESDTSTQQIYERIQHHLSHGAQKSFIAMLYNCYDRTYFTTSDSLRVTVDSNISFANICNNHFEPAKSFPGYIIEVKVPFDFDATLLLSLPFTRRKISKFSIGHTYA